MLKTLLASFTLIACAAFTGAAWAQTSSSADIEKGRVAYIQNGCWQCHGFVGQGGIAGLKLAPDPKPLEYFEVFVRHTRGAMPPYSEKILSKADMALIHT
jgi:ubiquinol-cytochrome c reductase cytochrome c subunit